MGLLRRLCRSRYRVMSAKWVLVLTLSLSMTMFIFVNVADRREERAPIPRPAPPEKKEILLLSYGRSGSSFTSGVISYHPDVFFVFEPLHALEGIYGSEKYFNNTYENQSKTILESFYTCNFLTENHFIFKDVLFRNSNSTLNFYNCFKAKMLGDAHLLCLYRLMTSCLAHNTSLIKTIRFPVSWTEQFLRDRPNFKLLVLFRDPRATLYSQSNAFQKFNWVKNVAVMSQLHCRRLERDLLEAERLRSLYPGRVKCIRYEDGATSPLNYTADIYEYLALHMSPQIIEYVRRLTSGQNNGSEDWFGIERNATLAMSRWRSTVDFQSARTVDEVCGHLYPKLGYVKVDSWQHLRSSQPLVVRPVPAGIF